LFKDTIGDSLQLHNKKIISVIKIMDGVDWQKDII